MSASSSANDARRALGGRLRELRIEAGLTAAALAGLLGRHHSKVSRIEHGKALPSELDIARWCLHCGQPDEASDLISSMKAAEGMWIEWRRIERNGLRYAQDVVRPLYERTRLLRAYSPNFIPGVLQTQSYTRAVLKAIARRRSLPDDVEQAVSARMDRQQLLRQGDHRFALILEETALGLKFGGTQLMVEQLRHLASVAKLPNVSLGIVPSDAQRNLAWPVEAFYIFDSTQVSVELISGYLSLTTPREIGMHISAFNELVQISKFGVQAFALIHRVAQGFL